MLEIKVELGLPLGIPLDVEELLPRRVAYTFVTAFVY